MFFSVIIFLLSRVAFAWELPPILGLQTQDATSLRYVEVAEPMPGQGTTNNQTSLEEHAFNFSAPVVTTEKNSWSVLGKAQWLDIHSNAVLPSGVAVPNTLWDTRLGLGFNHNLGEEKNWGVTGSFGSASDKPFTSAQVETISVNAHYAFAESAQSHWILFLNYSNNREFLNNVPLPGFAYIYTPSKRFTGVFGVPFAVASWRPEGSDWSWLATVFFPRFGKLEVDYTPWRPVSFYAMLEALEQSYLRANRSDLDNRFVYLESRSLLGVKSPLSKVFYADLSGGYTFNRSFFEAEKFSDRNTNSVSIANGSIFIASIAARF